LQHGKWLSAEREKKLLAVLRSQFDPQDGDNIMKSIEWIRESAFFEMELTDLDLLSPNQAKSKQNSKNHSGSGISSSLAAIPTIYHSHRITDRKSKFQSHFSRCWSEEEVHAVITSVRDDPKCAQAVHPCIYAWCLESGVSGEMSVGSSDDGEGGAAAFLENLLKTRNISNGVLMVTRWFGGTLLGPDRFRHISNIAEFLLNRVFDSNFIIEKEFSNSSRPVSSMTSQSFIMISSASKVIQNTKNDQKDLLMMFMTPQTLVRSAAIKWSSFISNRAAYPLYRLSSILKPDGTEIWSNYNPSHLNIEDSR
jgi:hypothetical protein